MSKFGYFILLTYPVFWLGIGRKYPFELLGSNGIEIGTWFWAILTSLWVVLLFYPRTWQSLIKKHKTVSIFYVWVIISLILIGIFDILQWRHFRNLGYPFPLLLLIFDIAILIFISLKIKDKNLLRFAWIVASLHKFLSILTFPLVVERSNMLTSIEHAIAGLLSGVGAYSTTIFTPYTIPYLPLTWISYLPSSLLGLDLRLTGLFYFIILGFLVENWLKEDSKRSLAWMLAILWFLNPYMAFRHELYLDFFWLVMVLTTILAIKKRTLLTGISAALSMATLQWAWILTPFWLLISSRGKWRKLIIVSLSTFLTSLLIFLPFIIQEQKLFMDSVFTNLGQLQVNGVKELCFGFATLFAQLKLMYLMPVVQAVILAVLGILLLVNYKKPEMELRLMTLGFMGFVMFNAHLENYFYLAPLILTAIIQKGV